MYTAKENRYEKMKYNSCGKSGLKLPVLSLGLWHNFGTNDNYETMKDMLTSAFDEGITHFDLANNYGPKIGAAEENFGKILKNELSQYRDELIISTKAGYRMWDGPYGDGGSRKYLISSLDASLKRMGLSYVDIFYHHRPDSETPIEESMLALSQIVKSGKALYVGLSNYNGPQMKEALEILKEEKCPFVINQNSYSIFNRLPDENGLLDTAYREGKGVIVFSPLAQGLLTNRYLNGIPEDSRALKDGRFLKPEHITEDLLKKIRALNEIAENRGQTLSQMALSWVLRDKRVTSVLIGASSAAQIRENAQIVNFPAFSPQELSAIDKIALN